ncbi:MAG: PIN domain-containing protein, partial [Acidimicrobiales bacterium]
PDAYLCALADEFPDEVEATIVRLAAEKQRPPKTALELVDDLAHAGIERFAAKVRPNLEQS